MNNNAIADNFSLLSKLMEIHGENSFKATSYSIAAFTIEKLSVELTELPPDQIFSIKGIGDAIGKKILEQVQTGRLPILDNLIEQTPIGVIEMLSIKGIGPKKIHTIWKTLEIETLGELLYACNENRLTLYKGFGEKTQQSIKESIEFFMQSKGSFLFAQIENKALQITQHIQHHFPNYQITITGAFARQVETIEKLEWVTTLTPIVLKEFMMNEEVVDVEEHNNLVQFKTNDNCTLVFHCVSEKDYLQTTFLTSCGESFLEALQPILPVFNESTFKTEEAIFEQMQIPYLPVFLRDSPEFLNPRTPLVLNSIIQPEDIKGIIHCHSKWSDGNNTLEQMAKHAISQGMEYLVISDHSKSAFYANGLNEERIVAQHKEIDELNKKYAPFTIFKSIECDILNDGSLDYSNEVLASFDIVIASIHSNLKMTEEKAMMRLLTAIENPYTNILGHLTGRLLLTRNGYHVNHEKIIEACRKNNVVIELNANPRRLDIDWRWIRKALSNNVLISINPDAHSLEGFDDNRFGVMVAQKAALTKPNNLSSFSLEAMRGYIEKQHRKR